MRIKPPFLLVILLSGLISMGGCKTGKKEALHDYALVSEYITGHTSGQVSRSARVVIKFASAVADEEDIEKPADKDIMDISPAVDGSLSWTGPSTLVFEPSHRLDWGKEYEISLDLDKIVPGKKLKEYSFSIFTPEKSFAVSTGGLKMSNDDNTVYSLPGKINTSDEFEEEEAESILRATQEGKELTIDWDHNPSERNHTFEITGIERKQEESEVKVSWNGKKAGIDETGEEKVKIPSLKDFRLLSSRLISSPAQYLEIEFSDIINADIELDGLVSIESGGISRTEREKNVLRVFPPAKLTGKHDVTVDGSLSNIFGYRLGEPSVLHVDFGGMKPAVRLPGNGVIVPSGEGLIFPFEAVNLKSVDVRITQIFTNNIHSFLQDNNLDGEWRINYVGRTIKRERIDLDPGKVIDYGRWNYFTIDLADMIDVEPGTIYRVEVGFRMSYSLFPCEAGDDVDVCYLPVNKETDDYTDSYSRAFYDNYYNWQKRDDPCSQSYYSPDRFVQRNILGSDFGIIAKKDANKRMNIIVTSLKTAMPEPDVTVRAYDFQNQVIATVKTDRDGFASYDTDRNTFLLIAGKDNNTGYLKTNDGGSLSMSDFDVSGKQTEEGIKGFIYGERGVWRPGDSVFVAFILEDRESWIPEGHPVIMDVRDARGRLASRMTRSRSGRVIYPFYFKTDEDDPTGNWYATVRIGGTEFTKWIRIETVKPNRLKINLDFGTDILKGNHAYKAELSSQWLHGTPASGMAARITATFRDISTTFDRYEDYIFDLPFTDIYYPEIQVYDGSLDEEGKAGINYSFRPNSEVNGMVMATFMTRVFEHGGDFSTNSVSYKISPFEKYAGLKIPWSDPRLMKLNTDEDHTIGIVTVDADGRPVPASGITVKVFMLEWRYWWSNSYENLASYAGRTYHKPVYNNTISTGQDGKGSFSINIPKSRWGRYLVLISMPSGNTAGKVVYFDWSYGRKESTGGAEALIVSTDKEKYNVGEEVTVNFPAGISSRALVSIENGSKVLKKEWIDDIRENTSYQFIAEPEMSPNIYVHVSLINPYSETANDLPVRMYGIAPVMIEDPSSHLKPVIEIPDKLRPEKEFVVKISEKDGRPMDYYFALVDEGLLDLTGFRTPDPWPAFYSKEALGVKTWDMYRYVLGAYGGELEKMFAIGGDEAATDPSKSRERRFEPVVKIIGPYRLQKGKKAQHRLTMPRYVGSVRAMLIAADGQGYGSAEKAIPVSNPLMVLGTLPRVLGPGEKIKIPVSVFAMEEGIKKVKVKIETGELLKASGPSEKEIEISGTGEYDTGFDYVVSETTGTAKIIITAEAGREKATHEINIDIRNPNPPESRTAFSRIAGGGSWNTDIVKFGAEGTNSAAIEVSGILPLNLEERLDYLIRYPHGCIEQTTSAVFPQLFTGGLLKGSEGRQEETEMNIRDGIDKLGKFQLSSGGMSFWPGSELVSEWGSVYAAHFLLYAGRSGYTIPSSMMSRLMQYIRSEASSYNYSEGEKYMQVTQAYRLYVLAEAGDPLTGAMNRLRERSGSLDMTALWLLAGSYAVSGRKEVAWDLVDMREIVPAVSYRHTYGTKERNMAIVLNVLSIMEEEEQSYRLAGMISEILTSQRWLSTQTTAWCLVAMTNFLKGQSAGESLDYSVSVNGIKKNYNTTNAVNYYPLEYDDKGTIKIELNNNGPGTIYASAVWKGTPLQISTREEMRGLDLKVRYVDRDGAEADPQSIIQGSDFNIIVSVKNTSMTDVDNLALSQIFPSGWEIINTRLFSGASDEENSSYEYRDIRDDRVYTYFNLKAGETKYFELGLNAAYEGEYSLPAVVCEGMYDNAYFAGTAGMEVKVIRE